MPSGLIELEEGILIEAEVTGDRNIAGGSAERVRKSLDQIGPLLKTVCRPIVTVWSELNRDLSIEEAEVQLGVSFEGHGNVFVAKTKAGANLTIKLKLKPKPTEP